MKSVFVAPNEHLEEGPMFVTSCSASYRQKPAKSCTILEAIKTGIIQTRMKGKMKMHA